MGNAAGRSRTGSYGGAGCGEQPAKVLLAGGLSPAIRFLGSLRSLGMTIRDSGPGKTGMAAIYRLLLRGKPNTMAITAKNSSARG